MVKDSSYFSDHKDMLTSNFGEIQNNIADALLSVSPRTCYYNGFLARTLPFLYLHLPSCIGDPVMTLLTDWFVFKPQSLNNNRNSKKAWKYVLWIKTQLDQMFDTYWENTKKHDHYSKRVTKTLNFVFDITFEKYRYK